MNKGVRLGRALREQFDEIMESHFTDKLEVVGVGIPSEWYGGFKVAVGLQAIQVSGHGLDWDDVSAGCYEVSLREVPVSTEDGFMHLLGDDLYIYWHGSKFKLVPEEQESGFNPLTALDLFNLL